MSSDAVATATREHAPNEAAPDVHAGVEKAAGGGSPVSGGLTGPGVEPGTDGTTPFAGGATRLAAVRAPQVMALQRLAGNSAVSGLLRRRSTAVQRVGPGDGSGTQVDPAKSIWKNLRPEGTTRWSS